MKDIETIKDIQLFVNSFYNKIQKDELLGPIFAKRIINNNWQPHLAKMYNFWSTLLLCTQTYNGSPFDKHIGLGIGTDHFKQWLALFDETIDSLFIGEKANIAKERANNIGLTFEYKLESLKNAPII